MMKTAVFLLCASGIVGLLTFAVKMHAQFAPAPDAVLVTYFKANRQAFEHVKVMFDQDKDISTVTNEILLGVGHYITRSDGSEGWVSELVVPPSRLAVYRHFLDKTKSIRFRQMSTKNKIEGIYFDMYAGGGLSISNVDNKGIAYIPADVAKRFKVVARIDGGTNFGEGEFLVHIEENWYIYFTRYY